MSFESAVNLFCVVCFALLWVADLFYEKVWKKW